MKIKNTSLLILLIILWLIFACQQIDPSNDSVLPNSLIAPTTPVVADAAHDETICVYPEISTSDFHDELSIVLMDTANQIFLYNLVSKEKNELEITYADTEAIVSPNFQMIAFVYHPDAGGTNLIFVDNAGLLIDTLNFNNWLEIVGWADDTRIILTEWEDNLHQVVSVLNLQNFDLQNITLSYSSLPDFDSINKLTHWWPLKISPNPTFSHFIYPSTAKGGSVVLWNNEKGEIVAEFPSPNPFIYQPKWLRDGERVLFVGQEEGPFVTGRERMDFYMFTINGELTRISNISEEQKRIRIYSFVASPDQAQVAFWASFDDELPVLTLLDLKTSTIRSFCVEDTPGSLAKMYWSPDSKHLLLKNDNVASVGSVIVVDIERAVVYTVIDMEDFMPVGWMISP